jgi:hypothetical protein
VGTRRKHFAGFKEFFSFSAIVCSMIAEHGEEA